MRSTSQPCRPWSQYCWSPPAAAPARSNHGRSIPIYWFQYIQSTVAASPHSAPAKIRPWFQTMVVACSQLAPESSAHMCSSLRLVQAFSIAACSSRQRSFQLSPASRSFPASLVSAGFCSFTVEAFFHTSRSFFPRRMKLFCHG